MVSLPYILSLMRIELNLWLGNLHLNVVAATYTPEIEAALEPFVYELVGAYLVLYFGQGV